MRRADVVGIGAGLVTLHALLAYGAARALPFRLDPVLNVALAATNAYALYNAAKVRGALRLGAFAGLYGFLAWRFLVFHEPSRPLFFIFAPALCAAFRRPLWLGIVLVLVACELWAQPYPLEAFALGGTVYAALHVAWRRDRDGFRLALLGLGLAGFAALLFPLVVFIASDTPQTLAARWADPAVRRAIGTSLLSATIATGVVLAAGVPLAYALARIPFPGRGFVETAIDLPILIPQSAAGVAFLYVLGETGPLGWLGLQGSLAGVVFAQVFVSVPFLVKTGAAAFASVDVELEAMARALGAGSGRIFRSISMPLAWRGIFFGAILAWSRAVSEYGSLSLFAYEPKTAPILVAEARSELGFDYARGIAVLLVLSCLWAFAGLHGLRWYARRLAARRTEAILAGGAEGDR